MIRRPLWLAAGAALGAAGAIWAEQRVRRGLRQASDMLTADAAAAAARRSLTAAGERVREAVEAGHQARVQREVELRASLGRKEPPRRR